MSLIPRLVVAYDFSDPARRAFELGVFMGRQLKAEVHVVTVLDSRESDSDTAGKELDDLRQLLAEFVRIIVEEVTVAKYRKRILSRLDKLAAAFGGSRQELEAGE